jgi:hypothetical protein
MGLDTKTYWLTHRQSQCDFDSDFDVVSRKLEERVYRSTGGRSACEDFACELEDFMCAIAQWDWECVI